MRRINALHRPLTTDRPTPEVLRRQLESFLGTFPNPSENGIDVGRCDVTPGPNVRSKKLATENFGDQIFFEYFLSKFFLGDVRRMSVGPLGDLYVGLMSGSVAADRVEVSGLCAYLGRLAIRTLDGCRLRRTVCCSAALSFSRARWGGCQRWPVGEVSVGW